MQLLEGKHNSTIFVFKTRSSIGSCSRSSSRPLVGGGGEGGVGAVVVAVLKGCKVCETQEGNTHSQNSKYQKTAGEFSATLPQ